VDYIKSQSANGSGTAVWEATSAREEPQSVWGP